MTHAFNPSSREAKAGGFLSLRPAWSTALVPGQPGQSCFKTTITMLKKKKKKRMFFSLYANEKALMGMKFTT
jgi:hypothetical protein